MIEPHKKKILIVEDEISLLRVLADQLQDGGFEVVTAINGLEGLVMAKLHKPDLIFLDVIMPEMNGTRMLRELRQKSWGKHIPVVILTNVSEASAIDSILDKGVFAYIVKADWELDDVIRIAHRAIEQQPISSH